MSMVTILARLELERQERGERKRRERARQEDRARWKMYLLDKRRRSLPHRHHLAPPADYPPEGAE